MTKDELKDLQEILENNDRIRIRAARWRLLIEAIILTFYIIALHYFVYAK